MLPKLRRSFSNRDDPEQIVAPLRDVNVGVIRGIGLKRRILEVLAFEFVTASDQVGASRSHIEMRVERLNAPIEVRLLGAPKRLKANSQRAVDAGAVSHQRLITNGIAESFSRPLRKGDGAGEEVRLAQVVWVVRCGDESGRANIQLRCRTPAS